MVPLINLFGLLKSSVLTVALARRSDPSTWGGFFPHPENLNLSLLVGRAFQVTSATKVLSDSKHF